MRDLDAWLEKNDERIHSELFELLSIPSISPSPDHRDDMRRAAEWIARSIQKAGLNTTIHQTSGNPIVVGKQCNLPNAPTVLVYGHYDVQTPDPLDEWTSPPFEPTIRDGKIFARGSFDDKSQVLIHIKALEAHHEVRGALPLNIVMLIEGEEEIGSQSLVPFVSDHRDELHADVTVISDTTMFAPGQPSVVTSMRGIVYFEIEVTGPSRDLHSGAYGGPVVNPANVLAKILASLHDDRGRVAIPGFYDNVRERPSGIRSIAFNEGAFLEDVGAPALGGEEGFSTPELLWARPTCDVHGLTSGYSGEGAKTILPASAKAKVSCRLVADQDPDEIGSLVETHVRSVLPRGVRVDIRVLGSARPWRAQFDDRIMRAAQRALWATFGREALTVGEGGTIPIIADFERVLKSPVFLLGFGLPGQNAHAPNEWMSEENFRLGMRTIARLWEEYAMDSRA